MQAVFNVGRLYFGGLSIVPVCKCLGIILLILVAPAPTQAQPLASVDFLTKAENQWLKEHPNIVLGVDPAWAPFEYIDKNGVYQGMAADFVMLVSRVLNLNMQPHKNLSWPEVLEKAKKTEIDLLPCVVKTPQRETYLKFTRPYLDFPMVIMTREDATFIRGLEDLEQQVIGVVNGSATADLIKAGFPGLQLKSFNTLAEAMESLSVGRIAALVDNLASISEVIHRKGITNIKVAAPTPFSFRLGFGVRKDWPELVSILDKTLAQISKKQNQSIQKQWISIKFEHGVDVPTITRYVTIGSIILFLVFAAIYYRHRLLQAELLAHSNSNIVHNITRTLDTETGDDFFKTLTGQIAKTLKADVVFIGLYQRGKKELVQTKAIFFDGKAQENFAYNLQHTPCLKVMENDYFIVPSEVCKRFPYDEQLRNMNIDGYAGIRLDDTKGQPLGILVALTHQPIVDPDDYRKLLNIFAVRSATELERNQYEKELHKLSLVVEVSPNAVIIMDTAGIIEYVNPRFEIVTGYHEQEVVGKKYHLFENQELNQHVLKALGEGLGWQSEIQHIRKDGRTYWADEQVIPIAGPEGTHHFVAIQQDITEAHNFTEEISYQATHDSLTGLINRLEFDRRLNSAIKAVRQVEAVHVLCFLDLDQFKLVNDSCGHVAGDEMLREIAGILKARVRQHDTLARLGGDEFTILMENCSVLQANKKVEEIRSLVEAYRFPWNERIFSVGVSIGLAEINNTIRDSVDLLKRADMACYAAKEAGRNRIHIYHDEDDILASRSDEMQWATRLNEAIDQNRFRLYAQTIKPTALDDNSISYEILLRLVEPENPMVLSPSVFMGVAERYGLATKIDRWVLENAFQWIGEHLNELAGIRHFSINLSGQTLGDDIALRDIISLLKSTDMPEGKIQFEITETTAISNIRRANGFIDAVKALGFGVSLDDFGSGLSSFGYLKNLSVDTLKIDGMFVKDILDDPTDEAMVKSINEIGHVMGLATIAEFVENEAIAIKLFDMGVDYVQGYGIGMPMPIDEIL